jgi:hypothetical protein
MGRDRNKRNSEVSRELNSYDDELNFTADGDDLFRRGDDDAETVDMENTNVDLTPMTKYKQDHKKGKQDLTKIRSDFDMDGENTNEKYVQQPDFELDKLEMEKVDIDVLNEEEKLIERSRLQEQKRLLVEYEDDRMNLLNMERREEDKMKYASSIMANELLLEENRATIEVRENEARTFRSFAKKDEHLKERIIRDEGELVNAKKSLHFSKNKARSHLFGGSRDKVYNLRWNQTPAPLEIKVLMARKVNEKLPRAHYALNVTIMDGFGGNEIFFKFSKDIINDDYRDKLVHMLKKEEMKGNVEQPIDPRISDEDSDDDGVPRRRLKSPKLAEKPFPNKLEFLKKTLKRLELHHENFMEKTDQDFDDVSLNSFLMPDIEHKKRMRAERKIQDTEALLGDSTMKLNMMYEFKQVLLNFQKNFSSLQKYDDPMKDEELEFCDKVYFMIPHDTIIEPSYIIMFELILLDEKLSSTSDRVVAWGAYPMLNRGKFKVPLIEGRYDPNVDKFKDIEGRYIKNIDEWVCNLYFEMRDIKLVECAGHKEFMEFPIPSEIQAYLEGKITEKQLNVIYGKRQRIEDGEGDNESQNSEEEKDGLHDPMDQSQSQNLSQNEMERLVKGEMIMAGSEDKSLGSDSDDGKSCYDIEGKDDEIPDLRSVDLREYKYGVEKKLLFSIDDEEEMRNIRYIFKELLLDVGIGRFTIGNTITSVLIMLTAIWTRMYCHYLFQYIFLKLIDVPVSSTSVLIYKIEIEYGFWNVYQEVISVMAGPLG